MNLPKIRLLAMLLAVTAGAPLESLKAQGAAAPKSNTPPSAQIPDSGPVAKLDEATLGKMFDAFATIAGGWYLEQRCNFFPKEYKAEFDWNVAQINVALSRQTRPGFLLQLQQSARNVAESKACSSETRDIIVSTLVKSRETTKFLTGQTYTPALGLAQEAQYIVALIFAQKLDDKCKVMPAETRKEFDGRIAEITTGFAQSAGGTAADRIKTNATDLFQKSGGPCDKAEGLLKRSLSQARQMSPKWKSN
jgi:hypothetical protein